MVPHSLIPYEENQPENVKGPNQAIALDPPCTSEELSPPPLGRSETSSGSESCCCLCRVLGFGLGVSGFGFSVWGVGFRVWGLGFGNLGLGSSIL